jgi:Uma2 family endonuclease
MAIQTKITAEEFLHLPESQTPTELINGEIIVAPAPELYHQDIVLQTAILIKTTAPDGKVYIAPVDVHLDDVNVTQPDVLWLSPDSQCSAVDGKRLFGAPDLVVEVLSPSTALRDKSVKFQLYEKYGVREYWIIEPTGQYVEVWLLTDGKFARHGVFGGSDSFTSAVLGDKSVAAAAIFGQ